MKKVSRVVGGDGGDGGVWIDGVVHFFSRLIKQKWRVDFIVWRLSGVFASTASCHHFNAYLADSYSL